MYKYKIIPKSLNIRNILHPSIFFIILYTFYMVIYPFVVSNFVEFFDIKWKTLSVILLYFFSFLIGTLIPFMFKKVRIYTGELYNDLPYWKFSFYLFYFLGILSFILFYLKAGTIPILNDDVENFRVEAKKGIGKYVIVGTALFTISLVFRVAIEKLNGKVSILTTIYTLIASLFILGIGFRGPVAYLILSLILVTVIVSDKYRINLKLSFRFILYGIVLLILVSIMGYIRYKNEISVQALYGIFWTMAVNVFNLNKIIENVPNNLEYMYGYSFIHDISAVFHLHNEGFLGVYLKKVFDLNFKGEGMTVTSPGEAFINLGYIGVVFHSFILGLIGSYVYISKIKNERLSSIIILYLFSINFSKIVTSGITPTFFFSLGPQIFLALLFIYLARTIKSINNILTTRQR